MSDCCPDACEECANNVPKDRREDYGDVCMCWCRERRTWLDFHSERHPSEYHTKDDWKAPAKVPRGRRRRGRATTPPLQLGLNL